MSDTNGNIYTKVQASTRQGCEIWYCPNAKGGANNVVTAVLNFVDGAIFCEEWSGPISALSFDVGTNATGVGVSPATNSTPPTTSNYEVVFAVVKDDDPAATFTAGTGYSNVVNKASSFASGATESKVISAAGQQSASFGGGTVGNSWDMAVATFKFEYTNAMTSPQVGNVQADDGDYLIQGGSKYVIQEFKALHQNNTDTISLTWNGRSTESTIISPLLIQIYNVATTTWETLARVTNQPADTDFTVSVTQSANVSNYYDNRNIVTFRSYQRVL